jgi:Uma2 family endonuclease
MTELGWFGDERVELLQGVMVAMSPQGPRHVEIVKRLSYVFIRLLAGRADVLIQSTVAFGDDSRPEPDVAIVPARDYSCALPDTAYLVIEVAGSSLAKDRGVKAEIYAAADIPEFWLVDLAGDVIEVRTQPSGGAYRDLRAYPRGQSLTLAPAAFPDATVAIDDIL